MPYSQYDEEAAIVEAFECHRGALLRFLDIGAYHPKEKSNTRALFELGWSGLMIEPSPGPMRALVQEYGHEERITLIQAAVGVEQGLVSLFVSDDAVSTTDVENFKVWEKAGGYFGNVLVPSITPEQISNQFGGFDFVSLDAEGKSVDLFLHMLSLGWQPRCWCVEHDNRLAELLTAATEKGYIATMTNSCNVVLVKK